MSMSLSWPLGVDKKLSSRYAFHHSVATVDEHWPEPAELKLTPVRGYIKNLLFPQQGLYRRLHTIVLIR